MQQHSLGAPPDPTASAVAAWLRAHPGFLASNPAIYEWLEPPRRIHGPKLADHMAAMIEQARAKATEAERNGSLDAARVAASRRAAEGFTRRVQSAVIALMRAPDPAWLATHELAGLLQVDAARICMERENLPDGAAALPRGTIAAALGQRSAIVRPAVVCPATPDAMLHGEAVALATEEALVRVPLRTGPALLAIACRDGNGLAGASTDTLAFLGQAVAAALEHK
jgi:uncharacterized protein YigA (DUF484 family)